MAASSKVHHIQQDVEEGRPDYREARWGRARKVYTVNLESKYLLIQNVHALGVTKELLELFSLFGEIEEYRLMDEFPTEEFCDVYWIKFKDINSARAAKKKLDNRSFYGKCLHVCYVPEYESVEDTREKLAHRRKVIAQKTRTEMARPPEEAPRSSQPVPVQPVPVQRERVPSITPRASTQSVVSSDVRAEIPTTSRPTNTKKRRRI